MAVVVPPRPRDDGGRWVAAAGDSSMWSMNPVEGGGRGGRSDGSEPPEIGKKVGEVARRRWVAPVPRAVLVVVLGGGSGSVR